MVEVDAGMSKFSGVVQCDTLIANSVVAVELHAGRRQRLVIVAGQAPAATSIASGWAVDEDEAPAERARHRAERPRAGEEVQAPAAGP